MIPAGKKGLVGETGQGEYVDGPAMVTSARTTADLRGGQQPGNGTNVSVVVNNYSDASASVEEKQGPDGKVIEVIIKRVKNELTNGVRQGGTDFARAMEQTYRLNRGTAA